MSSPQAVIECWLRHGPEAWFARNAALDAEIEADYADLHFGTFRPFYIFNLADACITIGVLILLARAFLIRERDDVHPASSGNGIAE